jgi:hypothetical protein
MQDKNSINSILVAPKGTLWNKGKLVGTSERLGRVSPSKP